MKYVTYWPCTILTERNSHSHTLIKLFIRINAENASLFMRNVHHNIHWNIFYSLKNKKHSMIRIVCVYLSICLYEENRQRIECVICRHKLLIGDREQFTFGYAPYLGITLNYIWLLENKIIHDVKLNETHLSAAICCLFAKSRATIGWLCVYIYLYDLANVHWFSV